MDDLMLASAVIGAQIQSGNKGFRQKDVHFLLDLFASWRASPTDPKFKGKVHNTQIQRHLNSMVSDNLLLAGQNNKKPFYRLSRAGILNIIQFMKEQAVNGDFAEYIFVVYLFKGYAQKFLEASVIGQKAEQSSTLESLKDLINLQVLKANKLHQLESEERYWKQRISENEEIVKFVEEQVNAGVEWGKIIQQLDSRFPYELSYRKPLTELLRDTPEGIQKWEILSGNLLRIELIWKSTIAAIETQKKILQRMS